MRSTRLALLAAAVATTFASMSGAAAQADTPRVRSPQPTPRWDWDATHKDPTTAPAPPQRDGFFARLHLSTGPMFLFSDANLLSGFEQPLPSDTTGYGFGWDAELGFEIAHGWALGGYVSFGYASELRTTVMQQVVELSPGTIDNLSLGGLVSYEAQPGLYATLRVGLGGAKATTDLPFGDHNDDFASRQLRGPQLALTASKEWHVESHLWAGIGLRLTGALVSAGRNTESMLLAPALVASACWF